MADYVLIDGDTAEFDGTFEMATVDVKPGTLLATGSATVGGTAVCVEGDEGSVVVSGCTYKTKQHTIPGSGTLLIDSLGPDQTATKTKSAGSPVLLVGSTFNAVFFVQTPALQPQPAPASPVQDLKAQYSGTGSFVTSNDKFRGV